jgi:hypothetical protein
MRYKIHRAAENLMSLPETVLLVKPFGTAQRHLLPTGAEKYNATTQILFL